MVIGARTSRSALSLRLCWERTWRSALLLDDLAAAGGAAHHVGGRGPALAFAGILALAGGIGGLAGARALARVDAGALHRAGGLRLRRRHEGAGGKDRGRRGGKGLPGHVSLSLAGIRAKPEAVSHQPTMTPAPTKVKSGVGDGTRFSITVV